MTQPTIDPAATPPDTSGNPSWTPSVLDGTPASEPNTPATAPFTDSAGLAAGASTAAVAAPEDYTSASQEAEAPKPAGPSWLEHPVDAWLHEGAREWGDITSTVGDDWRHLSNALAVAGMPPDPTYRLPQYGTPQWSALTQGIPQQYWGNFSNAVSADHAAFIRQQTLADIQSDQHSAQEGGLERFILQNIPSLALLAMPGVGEEVGAGRIAKFFIDSAQFSAENAALTAVQDQGNYTADPHDIRDAVISGLVMHGAASILGVAGGAALSRAGFAARRANDLDKLADLVEQGKVAPESIRPDVLDEIKNGAPEGFGPDSGGAARATLNVAPAVELNPETAPKAVPQEAFSNITGVNSWAGVRNPAMTFAGVLRGSANAIVRSRLGRMMGAVIGATDHSAGTVGASDYAQMMTHAYESQIGQIELAHKSEWMQEKGVDQVANKYSRSVQHEWSTDVAREIRGIDTGSQAAKKAATKYSAIFDNVRQEARRAGVDGFEHLESNSNYLPRVFDFNAIKTLNQKIGDQGMVKFLSDSLLSRNPEMDEGVSQAISKGYLQRTKRLALGVDQQMLNGVRLSDVEYIRDMLKDTPDVDPSHVDGVINMLKRDMEKRGSDEGSLKMAKHRVSFDETHAIDVPDMGRVRVADLFSNDAHGLAHRYVRTMSGAIGLAKVGIKSDSDFARSLRESISSLGESGVNMDEINTVRKYGEAAYKLLLGRPLDHDGFGVHMQAGRVLRAYAFARSMGKGFFSIANNLVRPWTFGYAKYTSKYVPAIGKMFSRASDGELNDGLMRDIERYTGLGGDSVSMSVFNHFDNTESGMGRRIDIASHAMNVAGRGTSHLGGMTPGLIAGQRMMAAGITDRIIRNAFGEADLPANRLAMMGLDQPMLSRIAQQVRENAAEVEGSGQRIRSLNFASWSDLDARDALLTAVHREARTLIHGHDVAATGLWMNQWWGRLASQLRTFPLMALSKQLLRGIHDKDMAYVYDLMLTGTAGAASAYAEAHLYSLGMNDSDREKYLAEHASVPRLIAAGIQRNPYSSMFPQLIDTASSYLTGHPVFDARATGLSGGIGGVPALDAASNAATALTNPLHEGVTQRTLRAWESLLPMGNILPIAVATNMLADDFPKSTPKDKDAHKGAWLQ